MTGQRMRYVSKPGRLVYCSTGHDTPAVVEIPWVLEDALGCSVRFCGDCLSRMVVTFMGSTELADALEAS